ncbi:MAG: hypothetical protein ACXVEL_16450, partial [Nocardioidaceae bacterium]
MASLTSVWKALSTPQWVARIVFLVGAVTVVSAVLPSFRNRTHLITQILPAVFPAAATTGSAAVGLILIALSRALRRGKFRAWLLATVLTALTVVLHLVKGLDVEEATLSAALFVLLVSARPQFTAKPDPRSLGRLAAVVVIGPVVATVLGFLWLSIDADGQAPGTTVWDRVRQAFVGLVGITGPVRFVNAADSAHAAIALVVLGAAVLLV